MKIKQLLTCVIIVIALPFASFACAQSLNVYQWTGQIWFKLPSEGLDSSFLSLPPRSIPPYSLEFPPAGAAPEIWESLGRNVGPGPFPAGSPLYRTIFGNSWQLIDNFRQTVQIAAGNGLLYQLHDNGRVFAYTNRAWKKIDDSRRRTVEIVVASGVLYQLHNNGDIWVYRRDLCFGEEMPAGKTCWDRIDNNRAQTIDIKEHNGNLIQLHGPVEHRKQNPLAN